MPTTQYPGTVSLASFPAYDAIMQDVKGVISPDVKEQMYQTAAERGIAMGSPGSPNTDAALMRAIGLTSQQLRQQGISELTPLWQQQVSEQGQFGRQATELQAAMDRLKTGNASAMDLEKVRLAGQMQEAQLSASTQLGLAGVQNKAAMERLQYSTGANLYESMWNKMLDQWSADQNLKRAEHAAGAANVQGLLQVGPNATGAGYGAYVSSLLGNAAYGGPIPSYQEYLGTQQAMNKAIGAGASFRGGNYYGPSSGYYGRGTGTGSQGGAGGATVIIPAPSVGGGYYAPASWGQHLGTSDMNLVDQAYPPELAWPEEDTGEWPAPGAPPPWMEE